MSSNEFAHWVAYIDLYGPVDLQRRYEEPAARVAAVVAQVHGHNKSVEDFLVYRPKAASNDTLILDPELAKYFQQ